MFRKKYLWGEITDPQNEMDVLLNFLLNIIYIYIYYIYIPGPLKGSLIGTP